MVKNHNTPRKFHTINLLLGTKLNFIRQLFQGNLSSLFGNGAHRGGGPGHAQSAVLTLFLDLYSRIIPCKFGDHMEYQGSNPGKSHAKNINSLPPVLWL